MISGNQGSWANDKGGQSLGMIMLSAFHMTSYSFFIVFRTNEKWSNELAQHVPQGNLREEREGAQQSKIQSSALSSGLVSHLLQIYQDTEVKVFNASLNMKYILVTGGVISGIGKGVISSSIGALLKGCGLNVTSIKIDPYLNIDAGTFSPYEHGNSIHCFSSFGQLRAIFFGLRFARALWDQNNRNENPAIL